MPLFDDLEPGERLRVIRSINLKMNALGEARLLLMTRRGKGRNLGLSNAELIRIETRLVQIKLAINNLLNIKEAFKGGKKSLKPPSPEVIEAMKQAVEALATINADNRTASAIVRAATAVAGALPALSADDGTA